MVYERAHQLAAELKESEGYRLYCHAKERAFSNETTRNLIEEYQKIRMKLQANAITGERNETLIAQAQKLGELLQFDPNAAEYLMAEYRVTTMLGEIYKILADAIDIDLSALES